MQLSSHCVCVCVCVFVCVCVCHRVCELGSFRLLKIHLCHFGSVLRKLANAKLMLLFDTQITSKAILGTTHPHQLVYHALLTYPTVRQSTPQCKY